MAIFDDLPFPFHLPQGQELLRALVSLYRGEREVIAFLRRLNLDDSEIVKANSTTTQLWHDVLDYTQPRGKTKALVKAAVTEFPDGPRAPFLQALLDAKPTRTSAEPADAKGNATFIVDDDSVTEPEALLFHDDLTIPTGQLLPMIATLQKVAAFVPSVCLFRVTNPVGEFFGTGFRIGPDLILTNEHVLVPKKQAATSVFVDFHFDVDVKGKPLNVASFEVDIATIKTDRPDDWGIVRVPNLPAELPVVQIANAPVPAEGDRTYILQHPGGQRKRIGYVRNLVTKVTERVVQYLTDTEPGSSGGPVFDAEGRCVALHHAGGQPTDVIGKPPIAKNEGIRISRVHAALVQKGIL